MMSKSLVVEGTKIRGTLAIPRVSRNLTLYLPNELEQAVRRLGGRKVPIYLEHISAGNEIGYATLSWNPESFAVEFEGEITDDEIARKIRDGEIRHVSLGADYERIDSFDGYSVPRGLRFKELSLVAVPGIPEANVVVESIRLFGKHVVERPGEVIGKGDRRVKIYEALRRVKEAIDATSASDALGQLWQPDVITLPAGLKAGLRQFSKVVEIPKGADRVNFTRVSTPSFAALSEGSVPEDAAQTVDKITVIPTERGAKQRISYSVIESSAPDIVDAIERSFLEAAVLDEDEEILGKLDALAPEDMASVIYGDGSVSSESDITSGMTFRAKRISEAVMAISREGYGIEPGSLVAVLSPKQYQDLLEDSDVKAAMQYGALKGLDSGVVGRLYGVDLAVSTKVPTGSGSGTPAITTYHSFVFKKGAVGLGISRNLQIETDRRIGERMLWIVGSHRIASAVLEPKAVVKIVTA